MKRLTKTELRNKVRSKLYPIGWVFYILGVTRYHDDGDGVTAIFRWWHPLTWIFAILMIIPCAVVGEKISNLIPLRESEYFRRNPERLNWL